MPKIFKQSAEKLTWATEYAGRIPVSATLSSVTAAAINNDTGSSESSNVLQSTTGTINGTQGLVQVKGGTSGTTYKVTVTTTLSNGDIVEDDILMAVSDT